MSTSVAFVLAVLVSGCGSASDPVLSGAGCGSYSAAVTADLRAVLPELSRDGRALAVVLRDRHPDCIADRASLGASIGVGELARRLAVR